MPFCWLNSLFSLKYFSMSHTIYRANDRTSISWASGTSTEIFIHPSDGDLVTRNFIFRISTATVEAESSTFTFFEGITRHLMILKGNLILTHEGRYTKEMKPFDQDTFSGEWPTTSVGKVTDFNLMLKHGATGSLEHQCIDANRSLSITPENDYTFVFVQGGTITIGNDNLQAGDLLACDKNPVMLYADANADLIRIRVDLGK
jgi:environmental stress-induced protein Ves